MTLPRFHLSGEAHDVTQATPEPAIASASWSGFPAPNEDELIGQTLNGTYIVEAVIGEGGMGRVYRASHTRISNKRFAIKVLRTEFTRNAEVVARFRREAEAAACISHPNVLEVYDVDVSSDGRSYIVCEYLDGLDLADYLADYGKLEPLRAVSLAIQVCRALEAAHEAGVIHRDVKPHNIFLLTGENRQLAEYPPIKVLDFGLSRFMDADGTTQLTRAGVIMGTPLYMSPEQAEGKPVDARADVYGLGAVLFAALAGRPPYEAESLQALVMAVINGAPDRLRTLNPAIPESLEFIVEHAMARNVDERYRNMQEFQSALEGYFAKSAKNPAAELTPARRAIGSVFVEPDDDEIVFARPKFLAYGAILTMVLALGLATSVASVEVITGRLRLSRVESVLLSLGLAGTLATPIVLLLLRVRKTVWQSHAKVLSGLAQLRTVTVASLVAYGATTLTLLVADDVVGRLGFAPWLGHPLGAGFRGFNAVYFALALSWAAMAFLLTRTAPKRRRFVSVLLVAATALASLGLLYGGFRFRQKMGTIAPPAANMTRVAPPEPDVRSADVTTPVQPQTTRPALGVKHAPENELAAASLKGTAGLMPLLERYPEDPNVLRPLLYAFASRATGLGDAMSLAQRLLRVAKEEAQDGDLRYLVRKATLSSGETSKVAFAILTEQMGSVGADILYDLWLTEPKVAKQAEELLGTPKIQSTFSPALSIAYDLRRAKTCAARLPLLDRAAGLGDRRSVAILSALSAGSKRGCGRWKRSPCPPACAEEARAYFQAVTKILERQPAQR
ncbi:MAG: serine/threonine-protein kinase [Polyangiaceae bacterium]